MEKNAIILILSTYLLLVPISTLAKETEKTGLDVNKIEELTGAKGVFDKNEEAFKLMVPREDLDLEVQGIKIPISAGLASWVSFKKMGKETVAMGDLVLLQNQINHVMGVALDNGIHITALHNHFLWESPRIMFMHIEGARSTDKLAEAIGKVFAAIKETASKKESVADINLDSNKNPIDPSELDAILGTKGNFEKGVYKVVFERTAKFNGHEIGKTMGVNTWAAFMGTKNRAVIDGDFAVTKKELQNVLIALHKAKINVTAIHQHMVDDKPHYLFVHFYAVGKAEDLAKGLKSALELTKR